MQVKKAGRFGRRIVEGIINRVAVSRSISLKHNRKFGRFGYVQVYKPDKPGMSLSCLLVKLNKEGYKVA